jgi:hypothetical protein
LLLHVSTLIRQSSGSPFFCLAKITYIFYLDKMSLLKYKTKYFNISNLSRIKNPCNLIQTRRAHWRWCVNVETCRRTSYIIKLLKLRSGWSKYKYRKNVLSCPSERNMSRGISVLWSPNVQGIHSSTAVQLNFISQRGLEVMTSTF